MEEASNNDRRKVVRGKVMAERGKVERQRTCETARGKVNSNTPVLLESWAWQFFWDTERRNFTIPLAETSTVPRRRPFVVKP